MKMASSQIEIASPGCVLRDHNRNDRFSRENNARAAQVVLEKNFKVYLNTCVPSSSSSPSILSSSPTSSTTSGNENVNTMGIDSWVANNPQKKLRCTTSTTTTPRKSTHETNKNSAPKLDRKPVAAPETGDKPSEKQRKDRTATSSSSSSPDSQTVSPPKGSISRREVSSSQNENMGAASLVQIWEARLNRSKSMGPIGTSRTGSGSGSCSESINTEISVCCTSNYEEQHSRGSEIDDSMTTRNETETDNDEPITIPEWEAETDKTVPPLSSEPAACTSSSRMSTDSVERERVRIADIIKRLSGSFSSVDHDQTNGGGGGGNSNESPRRCSSCLDQADQRYFVQVTSTPKIRGRQAFADLLMQIERDRLREIETLVERQAVSRFPQRRRIQSMLRIRCLQRCTAIQDRLRSKEKASDISKKSAKHLSRQKFKKGGDRSNIVAQIDATNNNNNNNQNQTVANTRIVNNTAESQKPSSAAAASDPTKEKKRHEEDEVPSTKEPQSTKTEVAEATCIDVKADVHKETVETAIGDHRQNETTQKQQQEEEEEEEERFEVCNQRRLYVVSGETSETISQNGWDESEIGEEEEEYEDQPYEDQPYEEENYYDWISDISRPRHYWESLRKSWYDEVLNTDSEKDEIRQLLERKTVSSFLGSCMRDVMDNLMVSHTQLQTGLRINHDEDDPDEDFQERKNWLLSNLKLHLHPQKHSHEEEKQEQQHEQQQQQQDDKNLEEEEEDYEEVEQDQENNNNNNNNNNNEETSSFGGGGGLQFHDTNSDYFSQSSYGPSPMRSSWSYRGDNEVVVDSPDRVASTSPSNYQNYYRNTQPSTEMELIYDLRAHMEQLQREMSELRQSIKCCIDIQMKTQQSTNHELHSVNKKMATATSPAAATSLKRKCCVCNEMEVDSLLYRCGHMCTCLKCGHELQWNSGKCPICRAPIVDVVRTIFDS